MERRALFAGDHCVAAHVGIARSPFERTIGFMFRSHIAPEEGLFFEGCRALHTCFVFTALDVVFVDATLTVTDIREASRPFTPAIVGSGASVFELAPGRASLFGLRVGTQLRLQ